jgi:hypothetical protein
MEWWRIAILVSVVWLVVVLVLSTGALLAIVSRATANHVDQGALDLVGILCAVTSSSGTMAIWMKCYARQYGWPALTESLKWFGRARRLSDGSRAGGGKRKRTVRRPMWWLIATIFSIAWVAVAVGFPIGVMLVYDSAHPMEPVVSDALDYVIGQVAGMPVLCGVLFIWIGLFFWSRESPRP